MDIEIKLIIDVDCGNDNDTIKSAIEDWILNELPTVWEEEDAIIDGISIGD